MNLLAVKKWKLRASQNGHGDNHSTELKRWVQHVIDEAETNGDTHKKTKFLALQKELL